MAFRTWLKDEVVYVLSPLESLRDEWVGIDAEEYFNSILSPGRQAPEPLLPAHGGCGFTIKKRIDEDLERFKDAGIKPHFVFNGLDLKSRDRASILKESRKATATLASAWEIYDAGDGETAVKRFGAACTYRTYHILRSLFFHLHRQGVSVQVAPYTAAAHLAYLVEKGFMRGVYGSAPCLLFGCDKIIIDFEWNKNQVACTTEAMCLEKLQLTHEQFVSVCLISGLSTLSTLPDLDRDDMKPKILSATAMLKTYNKDKDALLRAKGQHYQTEYYRAHFALKHPLLLQVGGKTRPKDIDQAPSDYHNYVGDRLPDELIWYHNRGLVGSRVINWLLKKEVLETPPLDGGLSPSYHELVSVKLKPIRLQTIGLLTSYLHRYFQQNDVQIVCYYNEQQPTLLDFKDRKDWQKNADTWHVKKNQLPKIIQNDTAGIGFMYAVLALSKDADARKTVTPRNKPEPPPLVDFDEVRVNVIWRFLHDRGYINEDHTLTGWGRTLKAAFDRAASDGTMATQESKAEMEEIIFVAIELIRFDVLGTQQMFQTEQYTGGLTKGSDKDKLNAMLVSRIACLGKVGHAKIGYTGPLSRNLLAYHQMIAAVREALRDLAEVHAGYIFLSASVQRSWNNKDWSNLAASLPFEEEPDLGLGLVVKSYLDELSSTNPTDMTSWFHHVPDVNKNLKKAWSMWSAINAGVQAADGSIVNSDTKMTFKNADSWLWSKLDTAKVPSETNGTT